MKYLVYKSPQPLRTGEIRERTRVKRLYFPADARHIGIDEPGMIRTRTGRRVHGVAVHYDYQLAPARAQRGATRYTLPARQSERTKVVELPRGARGLSLTDRPPEGPRMAVA